VSRGPRGTSKDEAAAVAAVAAVAATTATATLALALAFTGSVERTREVDSGSK
jgi:hypothetical protein